MTFPLPSHSGHVALTGPARKDVRRAGPLFAPQNCMKYDELPRERMARAGPEALTLAECLAVLLGTAPRNNSKTPSDEGVPGSLILARELVASPGSGLPTREQERAFFQRMELSGPGAFGKIQGLGPVQRAKLMAAFELGRRYALHRTRSDAVAMDSSSKTLRERASRSVPSECRLSPREVIGFVPLYPSSSGALVPGDFCWVETGARTGVQFEPAELFARVLALKPRAFFLFHNHPSGDPTPSTQDQELTERVLHTANALNIPCLGHAVVTARDTKWITSFSNS